MPVLFERDVVKSVKRLSDDGLCEAQHEKADAPDVAHAHANAAAPKKTGVVAPPNLGKMSSTIRERAIRMRLDLAPEGHRQGPLEAIARLVAIAQFGK